MTENHLHIEFKDTNVNLSIGNPRREVDAVVLLTPTGEMTLSLHQAEWLGAFLGQYFKLRNGGE